MTGSAIERILALARWAPSGDNAQPWRFEMTSDRDLIIHAHDTRDHCLYDLCGHASQLSVGALLETIAIAASAEGMEVQFKRCPEAKDTEPRFVLHFQEREQGTVDPLYFAIQRRAVQRRWMPVRRLNRTEKSRLEEAAGQGFRIHWFESVEQRIAVGALMFQTGRIRYSIPEAFHTHQRVIEWKASHSPNRIPDRSLGISTLQLAIMQLAMKSWHNMQLFNRFFASAWTTPLQLDFLPALACGAHFAMLADSEPSGIDDYVKAGRAVQRVWLAATSLGLWQQPEMVPLIFAEYSRSGTTFTGVPEKQAASDNIRQRLTRLLGHDAPKTVWLARIGGGKGPKARATRLSLEELLLAQSPD